MTVNVDTCQLIPKPGNLVSGSRSCYVRRETVESQPIPHTSLTPSLVQRSASPRQDTTSKCLQALQSADTAGERSLYGAMSQHETY